MWIIKAIDSKTKRLLDFECGDRDEKTFRKLFKRLKKYKNATFYTDHWKVFKIVIPQKRLIQGKKYTYTIEQHNSDYRHHLARFTRKCKTFSRSITNVVSSILLFENLKNPFVFNYFRNLAFAT